ncbi:LIM domain-containing protein WLIM1 [Glycine max]|nr:LIM domain-containing protein WLIM1 [Glycine max]KAH1252542.1 LIM domain-containing protein WLIM1 [Glycine max]
MAFAGTTQKCMACDKTVYLVDKLTADNRVYHKACFRCHHCKGTLKFSKTGYGNNIGTSLSSGVLSSATITLLKEFFTAGHTLTNCSKELVVLTKASKGHQKLLNQKKTGEEKHAATKVSSMFGGTRDKCAGCQKTVYPTEKVTVNGTPYHKSCFKCTHGGCVISPSNYIAHEGKLYCKHHHIQLIKEKGNLSQLEGDHEKSTEEEKINGEVVAAET